MHDIIIHQEHANQNQTEVQFHTDKDESSQKVIKRLAKIWRNWNYHTPSVGMQNGAGIMEKSLAVPQNVKHRVSM
jgi:hypothetical protein